MAQFFWLIQRMLMQVETNYDREVVCMAVRDDLVAVGSQGHIVFVDSRQHKPLPPIESMDHMNGAILLPLIQLQRQTLGLKKR